MDSFEISNAPRSPRRRRSSALVWNVLTILVFVTTLCVASIFLLIYFDPNSDVNPFPPPTLFPSIVPPTATVTPRFTLVPSWTPTNTSPQVTETPQSAFAPILVNAPLPSPTEAIPTETPPPGGYAFGLQPGSPAAISAATFHPDAGCSWTGIGGQATSLSGESLRGLFVQLGGSMPGMESIDRLTMTGLAAHYGRGGFEFTLADSVFASNQTLWVQLLDQQSLPLSEKIYFDTYAECDKNLVIIYFDQIQ